MHLLASGVQNGVIAPGSTINPIIIIIILKKEKKKTDRNWIGELEPQWSHRIGSRWVRSKRS